MSSRYQVIGVNDEKDFCQCCGKTNLRRVVWIQDNETQEIKHFGTTCASSPQEGFFVEKEIKQAVAGFAARQQLVFRTAHRLYRAAKGQYEQVDAYSWKATDEKLLSACIEKAKTSCTVIESTTQENEMKANNTAAVAAYIAKQQAVVAKLEKLLAAANDHFGTNPDTLTWANVGDLARIECVLNEIEI